MVKWVDPEHKVTEELGGLGREAGRVRWASVSNGLEKCHSEPVPQHPEKPIPNHFVATLLSENSASELSAEHTPTQTRCTARQQIQDSTGLLVGLNRPLIVWVDTVTKTNQAHCLCNATKHNPTQCNGAHIMRHDTHHRLRTDSNIFHPQSNDLLDNSNISFHICSRRTSCESCCSI